MVELLHYCALIGRERQLSYIIKNRHKALKAHYSGHFYHRAPYPHIPSSQDRAWIYLLQAEETDLSSERVETVLTSILAAENLRLKTLNIFTLHRTILHHISPSVLAAAVARLDTTDLKIADRMVGSGTMMRAGHL